MSKNNPNSGQNRKVITLFRSFSRAEMEDFRHFTQNSYFNTDTKQTILAQFLFKLFWGRRPKNFDAKSEYKAYVAMFDKTKSAGVLNEEERAKLNDKFSRLTKLGIEYLSLTAIKKDSPEKTKLLLAEFSNRKLSRFFEAYQKKEKKKLEQTGIDRDFYLSNYQLERSTFEYQFAYDLNKLLKSDNLASVMEASDLYYLMDRMLLHLAGMALINTGAKSYDFQPVEWIMGLSELPQYKDVPAIRLCRTACYMETCKLQSADDAPKNKEAQRSFDEFVTLLYQYENDLSAKLKMQFYTLAINFCTHQLKLKNQTFHQKGFELYQHIESKGLLATDGKVRAGTLTLVITFACRTGNFEWAEAMLYKYADGVDAVVRNGLSSLLAGQIAFYRGDFEIADKHFFETEQQSYHRVYSINSRIFRLKCLYELRQFAYEAAKVRFNSEIMFRKNNKVLAEKSKKSQINFIRVLMDLYKIRDLTGREHKEKIKEQLQKVRTKIEGYQYVTDAPWLLEKLGELQR